MSADRRSLARVSTRELRLLCAYVLAHCRLPHGYVLGGARMLAAAEISYATGLEWLARNVDALKQARPSRMTASSQGDVTVVDAAGESAIVAALPALDLACAQARTAGIGTTVVHNVCGLSIALGLPGAAAARGFAATVVAQWYEPPTARGRRGHGGSVHVAASTAAPGARCALSDGRGSDGRRVDKGMFIVIASDREPPAVHGNATRQEEEARPPLTPTDQEERVSAGGVLVDHETWVGLLDLVGGTLPPDGRGLLTLESEGSVEDAGPGTAVPHDD